MRIFAVLVIVGHEMEPSLLKPLPNRAMHRLTQHVLDVHLGFFDDEIRGCLNVSGPKYDANAFIESERVRKRFYIVFTDRVLLVMAEMLDGCACNNLAYSCEQWPTLS